MNSLVSVRCFQTNVAKIAQIRSIRFAAMGPMAVTRTAASAACLSVHKKPEKSLLTCIYPLNSLDKKYASTEHSHSGMWAAEKILSAGLLAVIPAAFIVPMAPLEYLLALSLVTHIHWGVEAIVVDYIRPSLFGEIIPKVSLVLVYALSMLAFGGLCYFNYTDIGISHGIRMLMKI